MLPPHVGTWAERIARLAHRLRSMIAKMEPRATSTVVSGYLAACMTAVALLAAGCQPNRPANVAVTTRPTTNPSERRQFQEAKDLFYQAVAGDKAVLPRAEQMLAGLGGGDSPDPQVVAYTGAATLLKAKHTDNFFEKAALGRKGMDLEDKAVAEAPDDLEVRFLRGVTYYQLPKFLGKHQTAVEDLAYVAPQAESAAQAGQLDPRAAAADLLYYGKTREDAFDAPGAIAAWRAAVRVDADSPGGRDALKHLAEHHVTPQAS